MSTFVSTPACAFFEFRQVQLYDCWAPLHLHPSSERPRRTLVLFLKARFCRFAAASFTSVSIRFSPCFNSRQTMHQSGASRCIASRHKFRFIPAHATPLQPRRRSGRQLHSRTKKRRQEDRPSPPSVLTTTAVALCQNSYSNIRLLRIRLLRSARAAGSTHLCRDAQPAVIVEHALRSLRTRAL
jgi:hypothetical protein